MARSLRIALVCGSLGLCALHAPVAFRAVLGTLHPEAEGRPGPLAVVAALPTVSSVAAIERDAAGAARGGGR